MGFLKTIFAVGKHQTDKKVENVARGALLYHPPYQLSAQSEFLSSAPFTLPPRLFEASPRHCIISNENVSACTSKR